MTSPAQALAPLLARGTPLTWVLEGDSITHGVRHTWGSRSYGELLAERVRFEMNRLADTFITSATSGDTSHGLITGFDRRVARWQPDVVLLMIGMNDAARQGVPLADYEAKLRDFAQRTIGLGALLILQTTIPVLPGFDSDRETSLPAYMEAMRRIAADLHLPLVDHEARWRQEPDLHALRMSNQHHPNAHGHVLLAHSLLEALGLHDPGSPVGRLFRP